MKPLLTGIKAREGRSNPKKPSHEEIEILSETTHCQQCQSIVTSNRDMHSHFQGLEISFPKIAQVVKFHQKSPAHQLQKSAQGLHLKHKGLRELKKLWRINECPLLFATFSINRLA